MIFTHEAWSTSLLDQKITPTLRLVLESSKREEVSSTLINASFVQEYDETLWKTVKELSEGQLFKFLTLEFELQSLVKVEDWFKDGGSALKRTLRKGKGGSPNIDSIVKGM